MQERKASALAWIPGTQSPIAKPIGKHHTYCACATLARRFAVATHTSHPKDSLVGVQPPNCAKSTPQGAGIMAVTRDLLGSSGDGSRARVSVSAPTHRSAASDSCQGSAPVDVGCCGRVEWRNNPRTLYAMHPSAYAWLGRNQRAAHLKALRWPLATARRSVGRLAPGYRGAQPKKQRRRIPVPGW